MLILSLSFIESVPLAKKHGMPKQWTQSAVHTGEDLQQHINIFQSLKPQILAGRKQVPHATYLLRENCLGVMKARTAGAYFLIAFGIPTVVPRSAYIHLISITNRTKDPMREILKTRGYDSSLFHLLTFRSFDNPKLWDS